MRQRAKAESVETPSTPAQWRERLLRAHSRRIELGLGDRATATAYRLAHGEADGVGEWVVDVYDRWLVAQSYSDDRRHDAVVLDALAELPFAGVYLKQRPRQSNTVTEVQRAEFAPAQALRGEDAPDTLTIYEGGVPLEVRLGDGLSTGLFLDQRHHRARLRAQSGGSVLNLFAYTCAFGVMAALGGAQTVNVDVSRRALEWGKRNYVLSGLPLAQHRFLARDAFDVLERCARKGERFDTVILDPPSYGRGTRRRFSAERDYEGLCSAALSVTRAPGRLFACSNQRGLAPEAFRERLERAAALAGVEIERPSLEPLSDDFPVAPAGVPHLKAVWIELRRRPDGAA